MNVAYAGRVQTVVKLLCRCVAGIAVYTDTLPTSSSPWFATTEAPNCDIARKKKGLLS